MTLTPSDFFAGAGFRATGFRETAFFCGDRLAGAAFFTARLAESLLFGRDFDFAAFRVADFCGTALVAFGRFDVEVDARRFAADFGAAR